jgi:hypothetical protein
MDHQPACHRRSSSSLAILTLLGCFSTTEAAAAVRRYLSYTPYWGLSNQLQELNVAANWAKYLDRTLVLPTFAQSRSTPDGVEPSADSCEHDSTNCEMLSSLIDVDLLRQYVPVVFERDYVQEAAEAAVANDDNATTTTTTTTSAETFTVDFGIDFSDKKNRTTFLVRWMEDPDRSVLRAYKKTASTSSAWCERGVQLGHHRCQRSVQVCNFFVYYL